MNNNVKEFKLGPLQELWLSQLEKYPERQTKNRLGEGDPDSYKACCLGELHLCYHRLAKVKLPFDENGFILDPNPEYEEDLKTDSELGYSYEKYGLRDPVGKLLHPVEIKNINCFCLAVMNDEGVSWSDIAAYVRANPENVFTKSV